MKKKQKIVFPFKVENEKVNELGLRLIDAKTILVQAQEHYAETSRKFLELLAETYEDVPSVFSYNYKTKSIEEPIQ